MVPYRAKCLISFDRCFCDWHINAWMSFINPFHDTVLFLYLLKTSENLKFSDVFSGYRKRSVAWNGLAAKICFLFAVLLSWYNCNGIKDTITKANKLFKKHSLFLTELHAFLLVCCTYWFWLLLAVLIWYTNLTYIVQFTLFKSVLSLLLGGKYLSTICENV